MKLEWFVNKSAQFNDAGKPTGKYRGLVYLASSIFTGHVQDIESEQLFDNVSHALAWGHSDEAKQLMDQQERDGGEK